MKPIITHPWNLSVNEALKIQRQLASKVIKKNTFDDFNLVAGIDVAYAKESNKLVAAVVILNTKTLEIIEITTAEDKVQFPYISGLFSFREIPPLIKAFAKLQYTPDLIVCDGQGYAHPRRFGLACHLGIIFDKPTIGCGKTKLLGNYGKLGSERGAITSLLDNNELIGNVLRTQKNINPIYVSIGHRISLTTASDWILKLSPNYRLPETTRQADQIVRKILND